METESENAGLKKQIVLLRGMVILLGLANIATVYNFHKENALLREADKNLNESVRVLNLNSAALAKQTQALRNCENATNGN